MSTHENESTAPKVTPAEISVFQYEDYHLFLRDWCAARRKLRSSFSFQELANRAGLKSRSFLRKVSIGEKDILHAPALRLCEAMSLSDHESEYFLSLVGYNNAADPWERDLYLKKMKKCLRPMKRKIITAQEFEFFSKWYIPAIWEIVTILPFGNDFKRLGMTLHPAISPDEARHALKVLLDLRLITPAEDKYVQTQNVLHTRDEVCSRAIKTYQLETMTLAGMALESIPGEHRLINTLMMGLNASRWKEACRITQEYRQQLIKLGSEEGPIDRVVQFNIQAFPVSTIDFLSSTS